MDNEVMVYIYTRPTDYSVIKKKNEKKNATICNTTNRIEGVMLSKVGQRETDTRGPHL